MAFGLKCPDCRKSFRCDPSGPWPEECPLCGAAMASDKSDGGKIITVPAFLSPRTRATDQVGRQLMDSSNVRAEKAAELAGCSVSEMSDMKVTDLRPTVHEGATAIAPVQNEVTRHMEMINARGGNVGWQSQGVEYSSAVQQGPFPNMGAKMRTMIHEANGAPSNRPALETQQPGYVSRDGRL